MPQLLRLLALLLPCVAVAAGSLTQRGEGAPAWRWLWIYSGLWLIGSIAAIVAAGRREPLSGPARAAFCAYFAGSAVPPLFAGVWLFGAPYLHPGSAQLFAATCSLPLIFCVVWDLFFDTQARQASGAELALPAVSVLIVILAFGIVTELLLVEDPFEDNLAVNSLDRSYWYIERKLRKDGTNAANSYGFLGAAPAAQPDEPRVLLIGDSIPAAGRPVNFPEVAEVLYEEATGRSIEIVNASMTGYSLEQMHRYYVGKLDGLPHDLLIVSFYLDDVNRELRYRKDNRLYTPSWPEWMQDVYYHCWLCRNLLRLRWFSEATFLLYRTRTYEEAFPTAIATLSDIHAVAQARGARLAVVNVPVFRWPGVLEDSADYEFAEAHRQVEEWCRDHDVAYLDLLPVLLGRDIRELRLSDTNIHFNDDGHRLVAGALMRFIASLL